jgi:hypothetical protein
MFWGGELAGARKTEYRRIEIRNKLRIIKRRNDQNGRDPVSNFRSRSFGPCFGFRTSDLKARPLLPPRYGEFPIAGRSAHGGGLEGDGDAVGLGGNSEETASAGPASASDLPSFPARRVSAAAFSLCSCSVSTRGAGVGPGVACAISASGREQPAPRKEQVNMSVITIFFMSEADL